MSNKLFADTVYKSINEQGNITYSSSPPINQKDTINRNKRTQGVADNNRIRRERTEQSNVQQTPKPEKEQGPYYGIPGHGILVLPKGSGINLK